MNTGTLYAAGWKNPCRIVQQTPVNLIIFKTGILVGKVNLLDSGALAG